MTEEMKVDDHDIIVGDKRPAAVLEDGEVIAPRPRLVDKSNIKNVELWNNFKIYSNNKAIANCNHCKKDISIGKTASTSHLKNHLDTCQPQINKSALLETSSDKLLKDIENTKTQRNINTFYKPVPIVSSFLSAATDWMIGTYQPCNMLQNDLFRTMQTSLNSKEKFIGK